LKAIATPIVKHPWRLRLILRLAGPTLISMRTTILSAIVLAAFLPPALAANGSYPVSGPWGQNSEMNKGTIDCGNMRVINFKGDTRTDSKGGVPAYRIKSIAAVGSSHYRVVDEFTTGQIRNGSTSYTLHKIDDDHIELNMPQGGMLKLQRCK
jgi:hypothetical protein